MGLFSLSTGDLPYVPNDGAHAVNWVSSYDVGDNFVYRVVRLLKSDLTTEVAGTRTQWAVVGAPPQTFGGDLTIPAGTPPGFYYFELTWYSTASLGGQQPNPATNYAARNRIGFEVKNPPFVEIEFRPIGPPWFVFNGPSANIATWQYDICWNVYAPARWRSRVLDPNGVEVPGVGSGAPLDPASTDYSSAVETFDATGHSPGQYTIEVTFWSSDMCADGTCELPAFEAAWAGRLTTTFEVLDASSIAVAANPWDTQTNSPLDTSGSISRDAAHAAARIAWSVAKPTGTATRLRVADPFGDIVADEDFAGVANGFFDFPVGATLAPGTYTATVDFTSQLAEVVSGSAHFELGASDIETLVLDGMDLNADDGTLSVEAFACPAPPKRPEWASGGDADGAVLERDPLFDNRELTVTLRVSAEDMNAALGAIGRVSDKIEAAESTPGGLPLLWAPAGSDRAMRFWVLSGEITDMPISIDSGWFVHQPQIGVRLVAKPFGYGAPVTYGPFSNDINIPLVGETTLPAVPGDVRAEAVLRLTDTGPQERRTVEWGMDTVAEGATPPSLIIHEADFGRGGAFKLVYDGASGLFSVPAGVTAARPLFALPQRTDTGPLRVKCRVSTPEGAFLRLVWTDGDGSPRAMPWASAPAVDTNGAGMITELDLGTITPTGRWNARIEGYARDKFYPIVFQFVTLVPLADGYGRVRAPDIARPGLLSARDDFATLAAAAALINVGTPRAFDGYTWNVGDANWKGTASGTVQRANVEATGGYSYPYVATATPVVGPIDVQADIMVATGPAGTTIGGAGVQARTDVTALIDPYGGFFALRTRNGADGFWLANLTLAKDTWYTVRLIIYPSGHVAAYLYALGATTPMAQLSNDEPALAVGGARATGNPGLVATGTANPAFIAARNWDNFQISVPATEDVVLPAGGVLEISSKDVRRYANAAAVDGNGQQPVYRGSRLWVPPAGPVLAAGEATRTQRTKARLLVKAHRRDLDAGTDTMSYSETFTYTVTVTPRYIAVPR